MLPLYFIAAITFIFLFGVSIGPEAAEQWLLGALCSIAIDIFILQPMKIWLKYVVLASIAEGEVRTFL